MRYADDFIITGISKELLEDRALPIVEAFMAERGLQLSAEKTLITHIDNGFDFLGQNLRKYNGKMLIKPSSKNVKLFLRNIRDFLNCNKTVPASVVITTLNPMIRGWCNYHRWVCASETFKYIDYRIWKMLWQWCRRIHKIVANAGLRTSTLKQWATEIGYSAHQKRKGKRDTIACLVQRE